MKMEKLLIELKENERKNLNMLKFKLKENKPFFFQKKKLSNYYKLLNDIECEIKKIDDDLLNIYLEKENGN